MFHAYALLKEIAFNPYATTYNDHMRTRETNKCNTRLLMEEFTRLHFPSIRWHARRPMIISAHHHQQRSSRIVVCSKQQFHSISIYRHLHKQHKDIRENTDRKTQATTENATQTRPHDSHGNVLRRYYFSFKIRVLVFVDIFNSIYTFVCGRRTFVCSEYKIWKLTENNRRNSGSFVSYPRNSLENLTIKWRKSKK